MESEKTKKVFLVGVGGIGVSAVAKYLYFNNYKIFGTDSNRNENVKALENNYNLEFSEENYLDIFEKNDFEFLVYTPAVDVQNHNLIKKALEKNIKIYSYPEFLGEISRDKFTISIAGTNGKTTTTTMLVETLDFLGEQPNAIVGGIMKKFGSNFLAGKSDLFVLESCEYKNSFLNLYPNVAVITNITPDHLDFFGDFENYQKVFVDFLENIKEGGVLICNPNDKNLFEIVKKVENRKIKVIDYKPFIKNLNLKIAGDYNRENAAVVLAILSELEKMKIARPNLAEAKKYLEGDFVGSQRRMDLIGKTEKEAVVYDDYAHNPEGIEKLIEGLRKKFLNKKIVMVFQPHLYSRTKDFQEEFVEVLSKVDELYLPPIYGAREKPDPTISSKILAKKIREIKNGKVQPCSCDNLDDCVKKIKEKEYDQETIIITVGAGDVYKITRNLIV